MITHDIIDSEVSGYVKSVSLTINKIVLTSEWTAATTDEAKAALVGMNSTALKPYANTYTGFSVTVGAQGRISSTEVDTVAKLNAMSTTALPFSLTISNAGEASLSLTTFYASVIGQDNMYGTETATFGVSKV